MQRLKTKENLSSPVPYSIKPFLLCSVVSCGQWPMGGKAKSRCHLGMLKVNNLKHSYLNLMKLGNYGLIGECLNNIAKTLKKVSFLFFNTIYFKMQKEQKWQA
jgi:hypothetical protein